MDDKEELWNVSIDDLKPLKSILKKKEDVFSNSSEKETSKSCQQASQGLSFAGGSLSTMLRRIEEEALSTSENFKSNETPELNCTLKKSKDSSVSEEVQKTDDQNDKKYSDVSTSQSCRSIVKISGLPYLFKKIELLMFLGVWPRNGEEGIKVICDEVGNSTGYAYLDLERHIDKMTVLKMSGIKFQNRVMNVSLSSSNALELEWMSTQRVLKQVQKSPFVHIGNLPFTMSSKDVIEMLSAYNRHDEDVYCKSNKEQMSNPGFCYVIMDDQDSATQLCSLDMTWKARKLTFRKVHPEVVSRWCRRNQVKLVVRDCIKYDMSVDVPIPELEPMEGKEQPCPTERNIQKNLKNTSSLLADMNLINSDPQSKVFFYDDESPDSIDPIQPTSDQQSIDEVNNDPDASVFIYDGDENLQNINGGKGDEKKSNPISKCTRENNFIKKPSGAAAAENKKSQDMVVHRQPSQLMKPYIRNVNPHIVRPPIPHLDQHSRLMDPKHCVPNLGPRPFDPNVGPRPFDPSLGPRPFIPNVGPRPFDPNMGPRPFDPNMGPRPFDPNVGPRPFCPNMGPRPFGFDVGPRPFVPNFGPRPFDPKQCGPLGPRLLSSNMSSQPVGPEMKPRCIPSMMGFPPGQRSPFLYNDPPQGFSPTIYIRMYDVPDRATSDDIKEFFLPLLPAKIAQNVGYDIYDIDFYSVNDALAALQRNGLMIRKNVVRVEMLPGPPVPLPPQPMKKPKKRKPSSPPVNTSQPSLMHSKSGSLHSINKVKSQTVSIVVPPFPKDPFKYHLKPYDSNRPEGQCAIQPMEGFFCQLCRKFYKQKTAGFVTHCKSRSHYENLKKHLNDLKEKHLKEKIRNAEEVSSV